MIRNVLALFLTLVIMIQSPATAADAPPRPRGPVWQPTGHVQIPLWPNGLRIAQPEVDGPEATVTGSVPVGGRSWTAILNVTVPTMTIYAPKATNAHAAIMVFPGGGYKALAIDLEGEEICDWVTSMGVTCVLLKYRVPQDWHRDKEHEQAPSVELPVQDAQRAMGILRQRAASLKIDPNKIGVIGFSAGGHLVAAISNADKRSYSPIDAADQLSSRPNFAIALYPGHLWTDDMPVDRTRLAPWNTVSRNAPPTFLLQSSTDAVDDVRNTMFYALALGDAGVPVDLHLYAGTAHAFGLRPSVNAISTAWPALVEAWLKRIKVLDL